MPIRIVKRKKFRIVKRRRMINIRKRQHTPPSPCSDCGKTAPFGFFDWNSVPERFESVGEARKQIKVFCFKCAQKETHKLLRKPKKKLKVKRVR